VNVLQEAHMPIETMPSETMPIETTENSALPAFLDGFAAMHTAMRRDAARLGPAAERVARGARPAEPLRRWWTRYCAAIVQHHEKEDEVLWPDLERRAPSFVFDRAQLVEDHHRLDEAMAAVDHAFTADWHDAPAAVETFDAVLVDHLAREQACAFPLIAAHYSEAEYAVFEKQFAKGTRLRDAAFSLPWVLDGTGPEFRRRVDAVLPAPMRVLARWWERRYNAMTEPLFSC
jgi:iron-sulfur cluster repair protein YtfE (RIC family)